LAAAWNVHTAVPTRGRGPPRGYQPPRGDAVALKRLQDTPAQLVQLLAAPGSDLEAGGFARSRSGLSAPDMQYAVVAAPVPPPLGEAGPPQRMVWTLEVRSQGRVALRSADPAATPVIDPGYLTDSADLEPLVAGIRQAREIAGQEPLAARVAAEHAPGDRVHDDEQLRTWLRGSVTTIFHPAGSCVVGGNDQTVCDPELRVRGVHGLRVVDASVMPVLPRGNTNAPTIALAERAADLILGNAPLAPVASLASTAAPAPVTLTASPGLADSR
jgi:choline dehydrogenase